MPVHLNQAIVYKALYCQLSEQDLQRLLYFRIIPLFTTWLIIKKNVKKIFIINLIIIKIK